MAKIGSDESEDEFTVLAVRPALAKRNTPAVTTVAPAPAPLNNLAGYAASSSDDEDNDGDEGDNEVRVSNDVAAVEADGGADAKPARNAYTVPKENQQPKTELAEGKGPIGLSDATRLSIAQGAIKESVPREQNGQDEQGLQEHLALFEAAIAADAKPNAKPETAPTGEADADADAKANVDARVEADLDDMQLAEEEDMREQRVQKVLQDRVSQLRKRLRGASGKAPVSDGPVGAGGADVASGDGDREGGGPRASKAPRRTNWQDRVLQIVTKDEYDSDGEQDGSDGKGDDDVAREGEED